MEPQHQIKHRAFPYLFTFGLNFIPHLFFSMQCKSFQFDYSISLDSIFFCLSGKVRCKLKYKTVLYKKCIANGISYNGVQPTKCIPFTKKPHQISQNLQIKQKYYNFLRTQHMKLINNVKNHQISSQEMRPFPHRAHI